MKNNQKPFIWASFFLSVSHKYLKCGEHRLRTSQRVKKKKQQIRSFGCAHSVEPMKIRCICNEYIGLQRDNRKKEKETKKKNKKDYRFDEVLN